jgi:Cdc25 family phosphatase
MPNQSANFQPDQSQPKASCRNCKCSIGTPSLLAARESLLWPGCWVQPSEYKVGQLSRDSFPVYQCSSHQNSLQTQTRKEYTQLNACVKPATLEGGHSMMCTHQCTPTAGGHIRGSVHLPSSTLDDSSLDEAIHQHVSSNSQVQSVAVHCMFSQQRGPRAALRIQDRLKKADSGVRVMVVKGGWQGFARAIGHVHPELLDGQE